MRYFIVGPHRGQPDVVVHRLGLGLAAFSILLGLAELAFAPQLARSLGLDNHESLIRIYGLREILTGIIIVAFKDITPGIWLRVLGDAIDGATLAYGYLHDPADRSSILLAFAAVTPVIVLDVYCALRLSKRSKEPLAPIGTPVP